MGKPGSAMGAPRTQATPLLAIRPRFPEILTTV